MAGVTRCTGGDKDRTCKGRETCYRWTAQRDVELEDKGPGRGFDGRTCENFWRNPQSRYPEAYK